LENDVSQMIKTQVSQSYHTANAYTYGCHHQLSAIKDQQSKHLGHGDVRMSLILGATFGVALASH